MLKILKTQFFYCVILKNAGFQFSRVSSFKNDKLKIQIFGCLLDMKTKKHFVFLFSALECKSIFFSNVVESKCVFLPKFQKPGFFLSTNK